MMLRFPHLQAVKGLKHAITTRELGRRLPQGGSEGEYRALNLGFHVGDDPINVSENRRWLAGQMGYDATALVCAQQVHGACPRVVLASDAGRGAWRWEDAIPQTDALITKLRSMPLLILVADCAPILLADPQHRVLAVVHAGWRGAVQSIVSATLARMNKTFGTEAEDVLMGTGPCLCVKCLEVGDEVAEQVPTQFADAVKREGTPKPHLDLRAIIAADAKSAGVNADNIAAMPYCPRCDNERFFSHRAQGGRAGRFGLVAWWQ